MNEVERMNDEATEIELGRAWSALRDEADDVVKGSVKTDLSSFHHVEVKGKDRVLNLLCTGRIQYFLFGCLVVFFPVLKFVDRLHSKVWTSLLALVAGGLCSLILQSLLMAHRPHRSLERWALQLLAIPAILFSSCFFSYQLDRFFNPVHARRAFAFDVDFYLRFFQAGYLPLIGLISAALGLSYSVKLARERCPWYLPPRPRSGALILAVLVLLSPFAWYAGLLVQAQPSVAVENFVSDGLKSQRESAAQNGETIQAISELLTIQDKCLELEESIEDKASRLEDFLQNDETRLLAEDDAELFDMPVRYPPEGQSVADLRYELRVQKSELRQYRTELREGLLALQPDLSALPYELRQKIGWTVDDLLERLKDKTPPKLLGLSLESSSYVEVRLQHVKGLKMTDLYLKRNRDRQVALERLEQTLESVLERYPSSREYWESDIREYLAPAPHSLGDALPWFSPVYNPRNLKNRAIRIATCESWLRLSSAFGSDVDSVLASAGSDLKSDEKRDAYQEFARMLSLLKRHGDEEYWVTLHAKLRAAIEHRLVVCRLLHHKRIMGDYPTVLEEIDLPGQRDRWALEELFDDRNRKVYKLRDSEVQEPTFLGGMLP